MTYRLEMRNLSNGKNRSSDFLCRTANLLGHDLLSTLSASFSFFVLHRFIFILSHGRSSVVSLSPVAEKKRIFYLSLEAAFGFVDNLPMAWTRRAGEISITVAP